MTRFPSERYVVFGDVGSVMYYIIITAFRGMGMHTYITLLESEGGVALS